MGGLLRPGQPCGRPRRTSARRYSPPDHRSSARVPATQRGTAFRSDPQSERRRRPEAHRRSRRPTGSSGPSAADGRSLGAPARVPRSPPWRSRFGYEPQDTPDHRKPLYRLFHCYLTSHESCPPRMPGVRPIETRALTIRAMREARHDFLLKPTVGSRSRPRSDPERNLLLGSPTARGLWGGHAENNGRGHSDSSRRSTNGRIPPAMN